VLASIALEEGLKIALKADIKPVRSKSIALAELFIQRVDQHLSAWGFEVVSARCLLGALKWLAHEMPACAAAK